MMQEVADLQPIKMSASLIDTAYERLVEAIATGSLQPGERLTQEKLAARLQVSRQPISHALNRLRAAGLATGAGRRLVVAPIDSRRLGELYQLRAAIDGLAARLAAEKVSAGNLVRELSPWIEVLTRNRDLEDAAPTLDWIRADVRFHDAIYRLSCNSVLIETVEPLWPHFRRSMGNALSEQRRRFHTRNEHRTIAKAILEGRPNEAESAARYHVESAYSAAVEAGQTIRG
jgi:DNA-binding GntR family transcriptional regulator